MQQLTHIRLDKALALQQSLLPRVLLLKACLPKSHASCTSYSAAEWASTCPMCPCPEPNQQRAACSASTVHTRLLSSPFFSSGGRRLIKDSQWKRHSERFPAYAYELSFFLAHKKNRKNFFCLDFYVKKKGTNKINYVNLKKPGKCMSEKWVKQTFYTVPCILCAMRWFWMTTVIV